MYRILKIRGLTGRYSIPSAPFVENENLTIRFEFNESRHGRYLAVIRCGSKERAIFLPKTLEVDIEPDFIRTGGYEPLEILLEFRSPAADRVIIGNDPKKNGFLIEPLYITRVETNTSAVGWLSKIEQAINKLNDIVAEHDTVITALPETLERIKNEAIIEAKDGDILTV